MSQFPTEALWISGPAFDYGVDDADYFDGHLTGEGHRNHVLSRSFELGEVPAQVTLCLAVLGYARVRVNGERVSEAELLGDWTNCTKLVYWDEFDVTDLLHTGDNVIEVELGNGWYNPSPLTLFGKYNLRERLAEVGTPSALVALVAGGDLLLASDKSWQWHEGSLLFNNVYLGETVDLRDREQRLRPVVAAPNARTLAPAVVERCRAFEPVEGTDIRTLDDSSLLVDFHVLETGFIELSFRAQEGQEVAIEYAEIPDADGNPSYESSYAGLVGELVPEGFRVPGGPGAPEKAIQHDRIICAEGENRFRNRFTYHSCRLAHITGISAADLRHVALVPVHTDLRRAGCIELGNPLYDELLDVALRTKLNNVHGVWEDCARERLGYGGDMIALAVSNLMSFDCEGLIRKTVRDFRNDQTAAGGVPETAPFVGIGSNGTAYGEGPLLWQLAYPHLVLRAYQYYGARDLVEEEWPYVQTLVDYLLSWDPAELAAHCLGDHGSVLTSSFKTGTPDKELVGWCAIARFARVAVRFCGILGQDASAYQQRFEELCVQIGQRFCHADGTWGDGTQTGIAFVADLGLIEAQAAGDMLAAKVADDDVILSTGIFGTTIAFDLLHRTGHDDTVERWLAREEDPSYRVMLSRGNRALAEQFEMMLSSYNHAMFSSYVQWFYQGLAGIRVADDACGCDKVHIDPFLSSATDHVRASLDTPYGTICVEWRRNAAGEVSLATDIPEGIEVV